MAFYIGLVFYVIIVLFIFAAGLSIYVDLKKNYDSISLGAKKPVDRDYGAAEAYNERFIKYHR